MTKVAVWFNQDIHVTSDEDSALVYLSQHGDLTDLDPDEARELVKALKKHIKKAEGN